MSDQRKPFYKRRVFLIPGVVLAIPLVAFACATETPSSDEEEPAAPPGTVEVELEAPLRTTTTAATTTAATTTAAAITTTATTLPATETQPPEGLALLVGSFKDADPRHRGSGAATIFELGDGSRELRVENLDVTKGPDLHVFLAPVADASERADVMAEGYLDLGMLKSDKGDQNYPIVGDLDLERQWTVVIYCVPFHVIFSTAPLA